MSSDHQALVLAMARCAQRCLARGMSKAEKVVGRIAIGALVAAVVGAGPLQAADFHLSVPYSTDGSSIRKALLDARMRRLTALYDTIVLDLAPGTYRLREPLIIDKDDSGTPGGELVLRGDQNIATVISGGVLTKAHLGVVDMSELRSNGINNADDFAAIAYGLFQGENRILPSRVPAMGYITRKQKNIDSTGQRVAIAFEPVEFAKLAAEKGLWIGGFLAYRWHYELLPVVGFDTASFSLIVERAPNDFPAAKEASVAIFNSSSAAFTLGTAVFDFVNRSATVRPNRGDQTFEIAAATSVLTIRKARSVKIERIAFQHTVGSAVTVDDSSDIQFNEDFIGQTLADGMVISGGSNVEISRSVLADNAKSAAAIYAGNRKILAPANDRLIDSVVANSGIVFRAAPAVNLQGVGNRVCGNLISGGGHWGIQLGGNEHLVQGNELVDLVRDTDDTGVIYMGRDWTQRGNRIVDNYIHDFGQPKKSKLDHQFGVYLDDQFSSAEVRGNLILGGLYSVFIGGGRDNTVADNVFVAPRQAGIFLDDRGQAWQKNYGDPASTLMKNLKAVDIQSPVWRARYPKLAAMPTSQPGAPVGNVLIDNVAINAPVTQIWRPETMPFLNEKGSIRIDSSISDWSSSAIVKSIGILVPSFKIAELAKQRLRLQTILFFQRSGIVLR